MADVPDDREGAWWSYDDGTIEELPQQALPALLRWIVRQLHLGFYTVSRDEDGRGTTLVVGQDAAVTIPGWRLQEHVEKRRFAVDIARILARAREEGVEPEHAAMTDEADAVARSAEGINARMNTAFHYAFELIDILEGIQQKTFVFHAPPVKGHAPDAALKALREATRCLLFGLDRAAVAVCRTCLEESLKPLVTLQQEFDERRTKPGIGDLELCIKALKRAGRLDPQAADAAHTVRRAGNAVLHPGDKTDVDSWSIIMQLRLVLEHLYA